MSRTNINRLASACVLACILPGAVHAADENIIDVTTRLDKVDAFDQRCSLREALMNANTNMAFSPVADECVAGSGSKTDVIVLHTTDDDNEFHLTLVGAGDDAGDLDIRNNPGLPADVDDLRMEAAGEAYYTKIYQDVDHQRVLENHLARTTLSGIYLLNGDADRGGGVHNADGVMLLKFVDIEFGEAAENGGGIYNAGAMRLEDSGVRASKAGSNGGGIYNEGDMTILGGEDGADYVSQSAAGSSGGGIYHAGGNMLLDNMNMTQNTAILGGGIYNLANLEIANDSSIWYDNKAALAGGGIANAGNASLLVVESSIGSSDKDHSNTAGGPGGGIANLQNAALTLIDSAVLGSDAGGDGGGIYSDSTKSISIVNSRIDGNYAGGNGGGLFFNPALNTGSGSIVSRSLVTANGSGNSGGGLWIGGAGSLQLANSTVSGNYAYEDGSAMFLDSGSLIDARSATIVSIDYNTPAVTNFGQLTLQNSIVSAIGSDATACDSQSEPMSNAIISLGHNLSSDASCDGLNAVGDITGVDPLLAPLGDNGGSTQTHALQGFSPAIDAGDAQGCVTDPVAGVDQRGATRPFNEGCDIGAHEQGAPIIDGIFADGFEA